MPDNTRMENLEFPSGGIDVAGEFQEQPPGTTPEAINVRGVNPDSLRERGGSRAGLIQYIPGPLFAGADLIQHLNVIVDPTGPAMGQVFEVPGDDWVEDPLNPGFFVPPGGWGWQPNPNAVPAQDTTIKFKQIKQLIEEMDPLIRSATFDSAIVVDQYVFVAVEIGGIAVGGTAEPNFTVDVENLTGSNFTQIGSYVSFYDAGDFITNATYNRVSLWYKKVADIVDDRTPVVTSLEDWPGDPNWTSSMLVFALNYSGVKLTSPIDDDNSTVGTPSGLCTTGLLTISAEESMILGVFQTGGGGGSNTATPAGQLRTSDFFGSDLGFRIFDRKPLDMSDSQARINAGNFAATGRGVVIGASILAEPPP